MSRRTSAATTKRMREALDILAELGFPRAQLKERSALTLLSLLDLKPNEPWVDARAPLMGITPMMDFFANFPKRRQELRELFAGSQAGIVYVTAFMNRRTMIRYLDDISWETEVWVAESPTHLIHFNGERFLGPYE